MNGVSDDIATFSRLGLIGPKTGDRAGKFADWCWFAGTLINLVENSVERGVILDLQHQGNCKSLCSCIQILLNASYEQLNQGCTLSQ